VLKIEIVLISRDVNSVRDHHRHSTAMSNKLYTQPGTAAKRALEHRPENDENGSIE
jgi:hypothetical protein